METSRLRDAFATARVARLATVGSDGRPHLVPITFAAFGEVIVTAIDHKPKSTLRLRRLANIRANPSVSVLVDHYDDADWSRLWWVRADGRAAIQESDDEGLAHLVEKYPQYADDPPAGPVIRIDVETWREWAGDSQNL